MIRRDVLIALACLLLSTIGCGGGGASSQQLAQQPAANPDGIAAPPAADTQPGSSNVLSTTMPALIGLAPGAEFDYVVSASFTDVLYQGSGRVAYDSAVLTPVAVARGAAIPASAVFVAKLDAAAMMRSAGVATAVVPFAFTGLPGSLGCGKCNGELLRVRFRLLAAPTTQTTITLINEPEYLQLRGAEGQRLGFDMATEVASK